MIINWGDAPFKAFITVTYPSGTCTVSLGDKSFSHTGGGTHTFIVNKKGSWTVKATATKAAATSAVDITKFGQSENVELVYELWLYDKGNQYKENSGGWEDSDFLGKVESTYLRVVWHDYAQTLNGIYCGTVNLTDYRTVAVHVTKNSLTNWMGIGCGPSGVVGSGGGMAAQKIYRDNSLGWWYLNIANINSGIVAIKGVGEGEGYVDQIYATSKVLT